MHEKQLPESQIDQNPLGHAITSIHPFLNQVSLNIKKNLNIHEEIRFSEIRTIKGTHQK